MLMDLLGGDMQDGIALKDKESRGVPWRHAIATARFSEASETRDRNESCNYRRGIAAYLVYLNMERG